MASFSGASSGSASSAAPRSGEDLRQAVDERKRKRMLSNRESARRSRMRKKKQADDMVAQLGQLREENTRIAAGINTTSQLYVKMETDNSVLRAQMSELSHRFDSLNEMLNCMRPKYKDRVVTEHVLVTELGDADHEDSFLVSSWRSLYMNEQPMMDMFMY